MLGIEMLVNQTNKDTIVKDIKIILHTYIYNNEVNLNPLLLGLQSIDPFNIIYDINNRSINIKMKKTSMKKYENYNNSILFYYDFFNKHMSQYLYQLSSDIAKYLQLANNVSITEDEVMCIIQNNIYSFFTLTLLSDNFIIIHL